ncbi:hypothetical protein HNR62_002641 [Oceanisphaera litoralis]|uniref:hypothetical protein n=1 Tax=Oceanisphaera litoralis TaxID=225144 RepID=UPI001958B150|nr:hypothetical protein [Oceanisphaera litoralis]MBM7456739.1 hypothetical protein [Oceanisphaera litoralis]
MICYPADVREDEIKAINDYWVTCDASARGFLYTVKEIDACHKSEGVRFIMALIRNCSFLTSHSAFSCEECQCKSPVNSRAGYRDRMRNFNGFVCRECLDVRENKLLGDARQTIQRYKNDHLQETFNLESLSFEETLFLLALLAGRVKNDDCFLYESPEDILITGISTIDMDMLTSFLRKGVITYIYELPVEVKSASKLLHGDSERLIYDKKYKRYRHPERVKIGIYLNHPKLNGEVVVSNVNAILYQKLQSITLSINEVASINNIIKEIQLYKLYQLVQEISKEYVLPIDNSNVLNALLEHLSKKYSPLSVNFTFNMQAKETIVYMRKKPAPDYIEKNYFTKFVGDYVQHVESKGWKLMKNWSLPPTVLTSSFEAIFSKVYLNEHFNWNMLSASEVVALWLKNVRLSESAQNLLTEDDGTQ